jgi:hypothetical protein
MRTYTPESTKDTLYILANWDYSIEEIIDKGLAHFPNSKASDLLIRPEYIHCRCITYDLYDGADYDNYLVITSTKE